MALTPSWRPVLRPRALPLRLVRRLEPDAVFEWIFGVCLLAAITWGGWHAYRFYNDELLPVARKAPIVPPRQGVRLDDPVEVRRWQAVMDALGEATSDVAAQHPDWARAALQRALALDPGNRDAQAMLQLLDLEPDPTLTPAEAAARERDQRVADLLGAAGSFLAADQPGAARPLLEEAAALALANSQVREALEHATS